MERIYIANLPEDIRIKDIDDFFKPFGKLMAVDVKNSNPACAFVEFDNPRSAFNAVQARNGYDYEGYRIQVRLVPPNEPSIEGRNRNSNNNGNFNDNWDNRYNSGGNNSNYQGNNMAQYRNSQSFGNSGDMGGGGRNSGGPLNTPIVQYPINSRGNVARRDDGNYSQSPSVAPGYSDDSYCQGLSRSGVQWFDRFLNEGYSRDQARERALERRSEPFVRGNQNPIGQNMSGFDDNMGRGGRGNNSSYGGNNYSDNGGFDMPMSNRNMPGPSGRSFGDNGFNNSNDFGGFNNNQPSMSNFTSGNNSGFSNWVSGSMLQNQPSSNNGGRNFNSGASVKRPAKSDQYTAGQSKRTRPEERNVQAKDSGVLRSAFEKFQTGRFQKAKSLYSTALKNLEKIADNESKGIFHPNDAQEKLYRLAIVNDFRIIYNGKKEAELVVERFADRINKVVEKTLSTSGIGQGTKIPSTAATIKKKIADYLEEIQKPINDKRRNQYVNACAAIKKLQAKKKLNDVEFAQLKTHQECKELFESDVNDMEQKLDEFRNSKNKEVYRHEITEFRYNRYKTSYATVKNIEASKPVSLKAKETLAKHKLFMLEFEYDLKHMQHRLKVNTTNRLEENLLQLLEIILASEKILRHETERIAIKHARSGKVSDTKEWNRRLNTYKLFCSLDLDYRSKDPSTQTEKYKQHMTSIREYIGKYESEIKAIRNKEKVPDGEEDDEEIDQLMTVGEDGDKEEY